ncbi:MAG: invasion protein CiaB [Candidatus Gracilibacteria bacterium]|nr:invasion protein CiaB [Candidatus Gracilibacteria bacterium]
MNKQEIEQNLNEIIKLYKSLQSNINDLLKGVKQDGSQRVMLDDFLDYIGLDKNDETRYAAYARIALLKEDPLILYMDNNPPIRPPYLGDELEKEKIRILDLAYKFVCDFHSEVQAVIISVIQEKELLTEFYLEIFKGVANVGLAMNELFIPWRNHIVNGVNRELELKFFNDTNAIMNYLNENNLFDLGHNSQIADRSYSALVMQNGNYISKSYYEIFTSEINEIVSELDIFITQLSELTDEIYDSKECYINYLNAIKEAFLETDTNKLVYKWSKVDEAWMSIKIPFQIGHPLEFYEDKYRKAVAPEWDLRILNTVFESDVETGILSMYESFYDEIGRDKYQTSYKFSLDNIKRVQLYLSSPILYYSAEMTGLFSAQVVPNDEVISEIYGKKIFGFPEMILETKRSSPLMKIDSIIYEEQFLKNYRNTIFGNDEIFYKIYDILTIGHEYGHSLWLDSDTQSLMNHKTGLYKRIEEFKATTGGLVMYLFLPTQSSNYQGVGQDELTQNIITSHLYRSVNLLKYRTITEIVPYYTEALIHLDILFESGILKFQIYESPLADETEVLGIYKVEMDYNIDTFNKLKSLYISHYKKLINIYLEKIDAGVFFNDYIIEKNGYYLPLNPDLRNFVEYYYKVYKKIGNEIEDNVDKNIYK